MEADDGAKEDAPQQVAPSANGKEQGPQNRDRYPMPSADPRVKPVFAKLWNVGQQVLRVVMHGLARDDPTHVSPETAVPRRMRIAFLVRVLMVKTMCRNP